MMHDGFSGGADTHSRNWKVVAVMIDLKPCPFCGGEAILIKIQNTAIYSYHVRCNGNDCGVYVATCNRDTAEEAIKIWNHRAGDGNG